MEYKLGRVFDFYLRGVGESGNDRPVLTPLDIYLRVGELFGAFKCLCRHWIFVSVEAGAPWLLSSTGSSAKSYQIVNTLQIIHKFLLGKVVSLLPWHGGLRYLFVVFILIAWIMTAQESRVSLPLI